MRLLIALAFVLAGAVRAEAFAPNAEDLPDGYDYTKALVSVTVSPKIRIPLDKEELLGWLRQVQQAFGEACRRPLTLGLALQPTGAAGKTLLQQADRQKVGIIVVISLDRFLLDDRYAGTRYRERYGTLRWQFSHAVMVRQKRQWAPAYQGVLPGPTELSVYGEQLYRVEVRDNPIATAVSRALLPCRVASGMPPAARVRNNRPVPVTVHALISDRPPSSSTSSSFMGSSRGRSYGPVTIQPFEEAEVRAPLAGSVRVSQASLAKEKSTSDGSPAPGL